uniref:Uncharacterized protein n=1 Tax=Ixodes ricinus TaxID=34613 RepID=A0A0K8RHJ3_IXORI
MSWGKGRRTPSDQAPSRLWHSRSSLRCSPFSPSTCSMFSRKYSSSSSCTSMRKLELRTLLSRTWRYTSNLDLSTAVFFCSRSTSLRAHFSRTLSRALFYGQELDDPTLSGVRRHADVQPSILGCILRNPTKSRTRHCGTLSCHFWVR